MQEQAARASSSERSTSSAGRARARARALPRARAGGRARHATRRCGLDGQDPRRRSAATSILPPDIAGQPGGRSSTSRCCPPARCCRYACASRAAIRPTTRRSSAPSSSPRRCRSPTSRSSSSASWNFVPAAGPIATAVMSTTDRLGSRGYNRPVKTTGPQLVARRSLLLLLLLARRSPGRSSPSRSPAPARSASRSPSCRSPARRALGAEHHRDRARRPGAQRPVPRRSSCRRSSPHPTEARQGQLRRVALAAGRRAGARLGRGAARRPLRGALPAVRRRQAAGPRAASPTRCRKDQVRATAHRIADFVYEKLTGEKGVFSTRIAYVVKRGNRYELQIADADGAGRGDRARLVRADHLAGLVARRQAPRLRLVREQEAGGLRALAARRQAPRGGQLPRLQLRAGLVARRQDAWRCRLSREGGSQIFLVNPDGSGLRRLTSSLGDRHRAALLARRAVDLLHLRPRRQPADLPHAGRAAASRSA